MNRSVFILLLVALFCVLAVVADTKCASSSTLQQLQRATFTNANSNLYLYGEGFTMSSTGFTMKAPTGSGATLNFANKVNIASGFKVTFDWAYSTVTSGVTNGFAFVIQSKSQEAREGSNQWLGYKNTNTAAWELDFYKDSTLDAAVPHMTMVLGSSTVAASAEHGSTCGSNACRTFPSATSGKFSLTITPTSTTDYSAVYTVTPTSGSAVSATQTINLSQILDAQGMAWIGFSTSALDSSPQNPFTITNVQAFTAGIGSVALQVANPPSSVVTPIYTDPSAYNQNILVKDTCNVEYKAIAEEIMYVESLTDSTALTLTGLTSNNCDIGPLVANTFNPSSGVQQVRYQARAGCKTVSSAGIGTFQLKYNGVAVTTSLNARFIAAAAVARTSQIISVTGPNYTGCSTTSACSGTTLNSVTAGTALKVSIRTMDEFGNAATGATIAVRLSPTEGGQGSTTINGNLNDVTFTPTKVTSGSTLEITINGQLLEGAPKIPVIAAAPYGPYSAVVGGTGMSQYIAGTAQTFELQLKDEFQNLASNAALSGIEFSLGKDGVSCTASNAASAGFLNTPCTLVASGTNNVRFTVTPTIAVQHTLNCKINNNACLNMASTYYITVSPTTEDVTKATFVTSSLTKAWPVPSTVNKANLQTAVNNPTPSIAQYHSVGERQQYNVQSYDKYGNPRSTRNAGSAYALKVKYGSNTDTILCDGSTTVGSDAAILATSSCQYTPANGYSISIFPRKTSYYDDLSDTTLLQIWLSQDAKDSANKFFIMSQSGTASVSGTTQSTLAFSFPQAQGTAGDIVTYSAKLVDQYNNVIKPFYIAADQTTSDDPNRTYLTINHALTGTSSALFNPQTVPADLLKALWTYIPASSTWTTQFKVRGAAAHTATAFFKQTQLPVVTYSVVANVPYSASSRLNAAATGNTMTPQITWTLYDVYGNPTKYTAASNDVDATGHTSCATDRSPAAGTKVCAAGSLTCSYSATLTQLEADFTCTYSLNTGSTKLKTYVFPQPASPTDLADVVVTVPKTNNLKIGAQWAKAATESATPTWGDAALSLVAGQFLFFKFARSGTDTTPLETAQAIVSFLDASDNLAMPALFKSSTLNAAKDVVTVVYEVKQAGQYKVKAQYGLSSITWSGDQQQSPALTIVPAAFSISNSAADIPSQIIACDEAATATQNIFTLTPRDAFDNNLAMDKSASSAWATTTITWFNQDSQAIYTALPTGTGPLTMYATSRPTAQYDPNTPSTYQWTFQLCRKTSGYWNFAFAPTATLPNNPATGTYYPTLAYVAPAKPTKIVYGQTADPAPVSITIGATANMYFRLLDQFDNAFSRDEMILASTATDVTSVFSASLSTVNSAQITAQETNINTFGATAFITQYKSITTVPPASISLSEQAVLVEIRAADIKTLSTHKITLSFTAKGISQPITASFDISVTQHTVPSYWKLVSPNGSTTATRLSHKVNSGALVTNCLSSATVDDIDSTCPPIAGEFVVAASVGVKLIFTFYDEYFNVWNPKVSDISGIFSTPATTSVVSAPLAQNAVTDPTVGIFTTYPTFTTSGSYIMTSLAAVTATLPGLSIVTIPGAIKRWSFLHPEFGATKIAGQSFTVVATPYDEQGNVVRKVNVVTPVAQKITLRVFEGTYSCNTNLEATTVSSGTVSTDVTNDAAFTQVSAPTPPQSGADAWTLTFSTQRAGSLAVSGSHLMYTYFMKDKDVTTNVVLSCGQASITFNPDVPTTANSVFTGLGATAIEAGDAIDFSVTLKDRFNNIVGYADPDSTADKPTYKMYKCIDTTKTSTLICQAGGANSCVVGSSNKQSASIAFASSLALESGKVSFAVDYETSSSTLQFGCKSLVVYPSWPSSVYLEADTAATSTTPASLISSLAMTSGIPKAFKLYSTDRFFTKIDYNHPAFAGKYQDFAVTNFTYLIQAVADDDTTLGYTVSNTTSVLMESGPSYYQQLWLNPAWPTKYAFTATLVNKVTLEPILTSTGSTILRKVNHLVATSPICADDEVYVPSSTEFNKGTCQTAPTAAPTFKCYNAQNALVSVTYADAASVCACQMPSLPGYFAVDGVQRCTSTPAAFAGLDFTSVPPRVCPESYILCGDLQTCVEKAEYCPVYEACPSNNPIQCFDGQCVSSAAACGTEYSCPSNTQVLCPNSVCVESTERCQQVRECNFPNTFRCTDGSCVSNVGQCPTNFACPSNTVKCDDNTCVESVDECPNIPKTCPDDRAFICASKACVVDNIFCPTQPSCGVGTNQILCPDNVSCVSELSQCTLTLVCTDPAKPYKCSSNGQCVAKENECSSAVTCPASTPVLCAANNQCVASKDRCDAVASTPCPASAPHRCGSGKCVKSPALCETLVTCPFYQPLKCSTGECVAAIDNCPDFSANETNPLTCPSHAPHACPQSNVCVKYLAFCPTLRSCPDGQVRCANGECYLKQTVTLEDGSVVDADDLCPLKATQDLTICPNGYVQCPVTNTGIMCKTTLADCPTDVVCPANAPIRCGDAKCVADVNDCEFTTIGGENKPLSDAVPVGRVPCGGSTWAASSSSCGTPATCPSSAPILCLDGSCVKYLSDCGSEARPSQSSCTKDRPFKCSDGTCALNSYSCTISKCPNTSEPVRCPFHGSSNRCVAHIEQCPNPYDQAKMSEITTKCTFGTRCADGTCVVEARLCPQRACPPDASYLCDDGSCKKSKYTCNTQEGCPFDLPIFCKHSASCMATQKDCDTRSVVPKKPPADYILPITCPKVNVTSSSTGEVTEVEYTLCSDGTCRENKDDCYYTGPFGCPPERPQRCANGDCVVAPTPAFGTAAAVESKCKTNSAEYNACPAHLPVRCPGGLCATSLTRCPLYSLDNTNDATPVCRVSKLPSSVDFLRDKVNKWAVADMKVLCDNGDCAFAPAECPTITPCGTKQFRCGDGTCRDLACDPSLPACRASLQSLSFMGAMCPEMPTITKNKCPLHLPYMCQSGECAQSRAHCASNYPLDLGSSCCGTTHEYKSTGFTNPQGEELGVCVELPSGSTCRSTVVRDGEAKMGCPSGTTRCSVSGFCVASSVASGLCGQYDAVFTSLNSAGARTDDEKCAVRCPLTNKCASALSDCTVSNGCPLSTPVLCELDGQCVEDSSQCDSSVSIEACPAGQQRCPNNSRCVTELAECRTSLGCPLDAPVLCADGSCKKQPATQSGATLSFWPDLTPRGISPDVCAPSIGCTNPLFTHLCGDGSCVPSAEFCRPIVSRCAVPETNNGIAEESCKFACPFTLMCVDVPFVEGTTTCDYSKFTDKCQNINAAATGLTSCPPTRSTLCPSGLCASSPAECSSPFYDESRTFACPSNTFQCATGECVDIPFKCIQLSALSNGNPLPSLTTQITNTNVCKDAYVCPNGLCVQNPGECPTLPACPAGAKRCKTGKCALSYIDNTTGKSVAGKCDDNATQDGDYNEDCPVDTLRCTDGSCRSKGLCPMDLGCPLKAPWSCTWRAESRCVADITDAKQCLGFAQKELEPFTLLELSEQRLAFIAQRFPELEVLKQQDKFKTMSFNTLATGQTTYAPNDDLVNACWQNCQRDQMAIPSTTLLLPTSSVPSLVISQDSNHVPRTIMTIPAQSVTELTEFNIYTTPHSVFGGASFNSKNFFTPYTFVQPKKLASSNVLQSEYANTVISTPFSCAASRNNTKVTLAQPLTVSASVDTRFYQSGSSGGETETITEVPCAFIGSFDSALSGTGCGGEITLNATNMIVKYDSNDCQWGSIDSSTNKFKADPSLAFTFNATFSRVIDTGDETTTQEWKGTQAKQLMCFTITNSTRHFADDSTVEGTEFCAQFSRITDLISISFPTNFLVTPGTTTNSLTPTNMAESAVIATAPSIGDDATTTINARLQTSANPVCVTTSGSVGEIQKYDMCLGAYFTKDMRWKCLRTNYEERTNAPAWKTGMAPNQVQSTLEDCSQNAYAFLHITLPAPSELKESFCFWCKYGWIILVVCIVFVVILLIVIILALKFSADRVKYKQQQAKLQGLQATALDLAENQGGLGVADADGEIVMSLNPLVLQLQDLNKQLEETNNQLGSQAKEEEYHIQRLEQNRLRIQAEIQRLEEQLNQTDKEAVKPKRVDGAASGPSASGAVLAPVRPNQTGASGPQRVGGASGPMRAPGK